MDLSHVIINFDEKSGGSKLSLNAYASRDSPPSHTLLDQNLDPRVYQEKYSQDFITRRFQRLIMNSFKHLSRSKIGPAYDQKPYLEWFAGFKPSTNQNLNFAKFEQKLVQ